MTACYTPVYTLGMAKQQFNFRLDPDLIRWVDENAEALGAQSRTDLLEHLLMALREGRLLMKPRSGPNPFPAGEVEAGSVPEYPVLVAPGVAE